MLALFTRACKDEDCNGYKVGEHLDKLLCAAREARDKYAGDIKSAEDVGREDRASRLPKRKNYDCDSKPSSVAEAVVGPCSRGVVHNEVKSAKSRNSTADTGGNVLIECNVDACGIGCCGVFTDCAKVKA